MNKALIFYYWYENGWEQEKKELDYNLICRKERGVGGGEKDILWLLFTI